MSSHTYRILYMCSFMNWRSTPIRSCPLWTPRFGNFVMSKLDTLSTFLSASLQASQPQDWSVKGQDNGHRTQSQKHRYLLNLSLDSFQTIGFAFGLFFGLFQRANDQSIGQWAIAAIYSWWFFRVAIKIRQEIARKQVGKLGCMHFAGSLAGLQMMLEGLDFFGQARLVIFAYMHAHHRMDGKPSQTAENRFVSYTSFWLTVAKTVTFFMGIKPNILQYIGHTQSITWTILT